MTTCGQLLFVAFRQREGRPVFHQVNPVDEKVTPQVGGGDCIWQPVRKGLFTHLEGVSGPFAGPVSKGRSHPVDSDASHLHPA